MGGFCKRFEYGKTMCIDALRLAASCDKRVRKGRSYSNKSQSFEGEGIFPTNRDVLRERVVVAIMESHLTEFRK